ncbi:MAG: hypothetical protein K0S34_1283 [Bacillales bacterium]|jgi:hypothetical protein|nr:hypothetical protein [Bacillales bacterium]
MDKTSEFVKKIQEKQIKDNKNKKRQGSNEPSKVLPNKQH